MILFLSAAGDDAGLLAELGRGEPAWLGRVERPGLVALDLPPAAEVLPALALARQTFLNAERVAAPSVNSWARAIVERLLSQLSDDQPWRLHVLPHYGVYRPERMGARAWHSVKRRGDLKREEMVVPEGQAASGAGDNRCQWVAAAVRDLLKERRRHLLKSLRDESSLFTANDSLVQVLLTSPEQGWLSVALAPRPQVWRQLVSPFRAGELAVAVDKAAPSRAFAKLVEAEQRLGRRIEAGECCVDLGAAPGGWSYVALERGARVTAVDRSPLREDLLRHPRLTFVRGDAFTYRPERPVDWLICDVIADPERTLEMLLDWLRRGAMRWFVVTLKLKGAGDYPKLDRLKRELPGLAEDWFLTHLCANKGEVCVFGRRRG